jgi:tetratricopeptide (TPR) repeat protein
MDTDTEAAIGYLRNAVRRSKEINYTYGEALSCYLLGKIHGGNRVELDTGIAYHNKSIALIDQSDSLKLLANNFYARGILYYRAGLYATALNDFLVSANYYKKDGDSLRLAITRVNIAGIYAEWSFDSYPKAVKDFERALKTAHILKNDYLLVYTIVYYAHALIQKGEYKKASACLEQAIPLAEKNKKLAPLCCQLYLNMGDVMIHDQDLSRAESYFMKSQAMSKTPGAKFYQGDVLFGLGRLSDAKNLHTDAEAYYQYALQLFTNYKMRKRAIAVYEAMVGMAKKNRDFERAFHLKALQLIQEDTVSKIQRNELANQMHAAILSIERAQQLEIKKKDGQIHELYLNSFIIAVASLSLTILLYFNKKRLRESKDKAALTSEKLLLQKELEYTRIGEEQLRQKLEFNAKTLTANTLNLIQKNEILEKIKTRAEDVRKASPEDLSARINSLINTANVALNIDKDWENFRIHFEQVHNNFFESLKMRYPDLNSNDLRLCALLKLNLDTKEIATVMDISPESVKVARSRLRKKLQLETSDNLSSFITSVDALPSVTQASGHPQHIEI